jgi:probable LLM family oxidoreductase
MSNAETNPFEIGHMTFVELTADPRTGAVPSAHERARDTIEQARLADQVGLDLFGVGEHHRTDFVGSAPAMVLAAAAEATERIRLTSSVTVLSSEDPVRVWEQFATLDQFSGGRAEIIAGRGSYTESFPLFGYDLQDYADLFREKLDLLLKIRAQNPVTWRGRFRPDLHDADIGPRALQDELPIWVGVGGSLASAISTGRLGLPMAMALLLGPIGYHEQTVELYRQAAAEAGHDVAALRTSINLHGYVGRTSQSARDTMYPYFAQGMLDNNHQRGRGFHMPRTAFDAQTSPGAGLVVGSPQEVVDKLLAYHELYGLDRALIQLGFGGMPQKDVLTAIELLGTEVAPVVRREVAARTEQAA